MANLIRQRKAHLSGLGGFPHSLLHQDTVSRALTIASVRRVLVG
ncbi:MULTISPECIES: hypothetical protein [unclassified Moorena]|nr:MULTISPECIES: hypothetical protein [unclassified Moorena]